MEFTEQEVQFLMREHVVETAAFGAPRHLKEQPDLRQLGCPWPIFRKILEQRAGKLDGQFTQFRARQVQQVCAEGARTVQLLAESITGRSTLEEKLNGPNLF